LRAAALKLPDSAIWQKKRIALSLSIVVDSAKVIRDFAYLS